MHQLKALIWMWYKVRLRSPFMLALDVAGPIVTMILYLGLKVLLASTSAPTLDNDSSKTGLFRGSISPIVDVRQELSKHMCPQILFYTDGQGQSVGRAIGNLCGVQLVGVSSRDELVSKLEKSLASRMNHRQPGTDLNKSNSSQVGCFQLPGNSEPIYQTGIVQTSGKTIEIYMTDIAGSTVLHQPYSQGSTYNEFRLPHSDINSGLHLLEICLASLFSASQDSGNQTNSDSTRWHLKAYPALTGGHLIPATSMLLLLLANFCNVIPTVFRVSDANELGLHRYIRVSGTPAPYYWISMLACMTVHLTIQSLVIAIIMAIPTSSYLLDPLSESSITIRWILLLTYSVSLNVHAAAICSLLDRSSHALLLCCLLASCYAMFPMTLMIQWNPYGFRQFYPINYLQLMNPPSNFCALLFVIFGVTMQTNERFNWLHMSERIVGGGFSDLSIGQLWMLLIYQGVLWFLFGLINDQYLYKTSRSCVGSCVAFLNECLLCNALCASKSNRTVEDVKTKSALKPVGSSIRVDPNRICCSLRHVYVSGPTVMLAQSKGNPLRLSSDQLKQMKSREGRTASKAHQYVVDRSQRSQHSAQRVEPIVLDDAIKQHIVWYKTQINYKDLNLDFRFNQISFVLGQTDSKNLLFSTILGTTPMDSGHLLLDGETYSATTLGLARPQIGHLCERDNFFQELTIFENLQFFGSLREPSYKNYDSESLFVLSLLHLSSRKDSMPAILTARSARKLALSVATVGYTKLLLLVEPTLNLRWKSRCHVLNLLKKYKSIRSIVVDTSDVDEAVAFGDRIVLLKNSQADLDGTPAKLNKSLRCGYWLVFEQTKSTHSGGHSQTVNPEAMKQLDATINDIFKHDKLALEITKGHSEYQDSNRGNRTLSSKISLFGSSKLATASADKKSNYSRLSPAQTDRLVVIAKIRQSEQSTRALCVALRKFGHHSSGTGSDVSGFRLVELTYESIEDVLVLRMSRAVYPDLPPDLLLSLQHRTKTHQRAIDPSPVSVRRLSKSAKGSAQTIFSSTLPTLIKDRLSSSFEMSILIGSIICALSIVAVALLTLRQTGVPQTSAFGGAKRAIGYGGQLHSAHSFVPSSRSSAGDVDGSHGYIVPDSDIERLYKYRVGLIIVADGSAENITKLRDSYLGRWDGNKNLTIVVDNSNANLSDINIVTRFIRDSRELVASILVLNVKSTETTVIFEPHLPNAMMAGIRAFINYNAPKRVQLAKRRQSAANETATTITATTATTLTTAAGASTSAPTSTTTTSTATTSSASTAPTSTSTQRPDIPSNSTEGSSSSSSSFVGSRHYFYQAWHEMITGYFRRRFVYSIGFGLAESIAIGSLLLAPIRHRSELHPTKVSATYWISMAFFDLIVSTILIFGYIALFASIEGTRSIAYIVPMFIVLFLYKLATLPIPYLISLAADSSTYGFLFILLLYMTICWDFSIHLKTFTEWTMIGNSHLYTIASWVLLAMPISSLIDTLTVINHLNCINKLCPQVPAYTPTRNIVQLEGVQGYTLVDELLEKVRECLASGKTGVSTDVFHQRSLGILWCLYLFALFAIIGWVFLLTCERFFGTVARRFNSARTSDDPMKTVVRFSDNTTSMFKWDRERERLVSEYTRCMNDSRYVELMATNCILLRIWLKPMSDPNSLDKRMSTVLEPLYSLGHTKNDIQVELKTTLQIFVRIGDESRRCKVDKVKLIEAYSRYITAHGQTIAKFAVVDWSREALYKILLHGHYNAKSTSTVI